jgi:hypothetical protein
LKNQNVRKRFLSKKTMFIGSFLELKYDFFLELFATQQQLLFKNFGNTSSVFWNTPWTWELELLRLFFIFLHCTIQQHASTEIGSATETFLTPTKNLCHVLSPPSCSPISIPELASTTPVTPPTGWVDKSLSLSCTYVIKRIQLSYA